MGHRASGRSCNITMVGYGIPQHAGLFSRSRVMSCWSGLCRRWRGAELLHQGEEVRHTPMLGDLPVVHAHGVHGLEVDLPGQTGYSPSSAQMPAIRPIASPISVAMRVSSWSVLAG